jgi:hypothetical protein
MVPLSVILENVLLTLSSMQRPRHANPVEQTAILVRPMVVENATLVSVRLDTFWTAPLRLAYPVVLGVHHATRMVPTSVMVSRHVQAILSMMPIPKPAKHVILTASLALKLEQHSVMLASACLLLVCPTPKPAKHALPTV